MHRAALTQHQSSRPRSRTEKRMRRKVRRSLHRAERALVQFTLAAASGAFDGRALFDVQVERAHLVNQYRQAGQLHAIITGGFVS